MNIKCQILSVATLCGIDLHIQTNVTIVSNFWKKRMSFVILLNKIIKSGSVGIVNKGGAM